MDQQRRNEIGVLADRVREALGLSTPVNVEAAVEMLGGTLKDIGTGDEPEAYVEKQANSFEIGIHPDVSPKRRRFSIAHELGHLFLHMGFIIDEEKWNSVTRYEESIKYRFGYSEEEYEAHEFAAAFLMPESEFRAIADAHRVENKYRISGIAEHFQVSEDAASNRGRWLKMFAWD